MITVWILAGMLLQGSAAVPPPPAVYATAASCESAKQEIISFLSYSKLKCIQIQTVK